MAYQRRILTDAAPILVDSFITVTSAGVTSDSLDTRNYRDVEFLIKIDDRQLADALSVNVQFSATDSVSDEDWANLNTENISAGIAPQTLYSADFDLSTFSTGTPFTISVSVPARARYMRIILTPNDTITTTDVNAIRRA